jgi:hypothetical protein
VQFGAVTRCVSCDASKAIEIEEFDRSKAIEAHARAVERHLLSRREPVPRRYRRRRCLSRACGGLLMPAGNSRSTRSHPRLADGEATQLSRCRQECGSVISMRHRGGL